MTEIPPPLRSTVTAPRTPSHIEPRQTQVGRPDFRSLLQPQAAPGNLSQGILPEDVAILSAAAEVFNAHGFFVAGFPKPDDAAQSAVSRVGNEPGANRSARPSLGQMEPDAGEDSRTNIELGGQISPPERSRGPEQQTAAKILESSRSAREGRTLPRATIGPAVSPKPKGPDPQAAGITPSGRAVQSKASTRPMEVNGDRLIFQIGVQSVHLTGRLQGLSKDEQERLIASLTAVLASHGLSLGDARLNGMPVTSEILRSNH